MHSDPSLRRFQLVFVPSYYLRLESLFFHIESFAPGGLRSVCKDHLISVRGVDFFLPYVSLFVTN